MNKFQIIYGNRYHIISKKRSTIEAQRTTYRMISIISNISLLSKNEKEMGGGGGIMNKNITQHFTIALYLNNIQLLQDTN